jgi:hypothetical protein
MMLEMAILAGLVLLWLLFCLFIFVLLHQKQCMQRAKFSMM